MPEVNAGAVQDRLRAALDAQARSQAAAKEASEAAAAARAANTPPPPPETPGQAMPPRPPANREVSSGG